MIPEVPQPFSQAKKPRMLEALQCMKQFFAMKNALFSIQLTYIISFNILNDPIDSTFISIWQTILEVN